MSIRADIDIDVPDRLALLNLIKHIPARLETDKSHNSGIYVTEIPVDPLTRIAAIDYQQADARGYFKLDLLNMSVYQMISNTDHYTKMLETVVNWKRLWEDTEWAKKLVHVGNYTELLRTMKPDSIPRMAAFISIIRPGKAHLQNKPWSDVFSSVWNGDTSQGYTFKKAHAIGYAALVSLHMNLLEDAEDIIQFSEPAQ